MDVVRGQEGWKACQCVATWWLDFCPKSQHTTLRVAGRGHSNSPAKTAPSLTNMPSQGPAGAVPLQLAHSAGTLMLLFSQPELVKPLQSVLLLHCAASCRAVFPVSCGARSPSGLSLDGVKVYPEMAVQATAVLRREGGARGAGQGRG